METCAIKSGPKVGFVIAKTKEWICTTKETDMGKIRKRIVELSKGCGAGGKNIPLSEKE
jgi:hypothetical protein